MVHVGIHVEELGEADMVEALHGQPVVEPCRALYVETQAFRQLQHETRGVRLLREKTRRVMAQCTALTPN